MTDLGSTSNLISILFIAAVTFVYFRKRDFYIVIMEYRIVGYNEYGKGDNIENSYGKCFDDYLAARAFFELQEHYYYGVSPQYENQQKIDYLYAVPALTARHAIRKMIKKPHHEAKLLAETSSSSLHNLKKYWDEERKAAHDNADTLL